MHTPNNIPDPVVVNALPETQSEIRIDCSWLLNQPIFLGMKPYLGI
jgi:hypothetical protein